jgi:transcriptional regulator with XRE-family HTH domain
MAEAPDGPAGTRAAARREVGDLLRSRREGLRPQDVGLPAGVRRRARGLRREEVALLAAISPTYYTFLEQGRDVRPSRDVLDALARALRLSGAERAHLHQLTHGSPPEEPAVPEALAPGVDALVARLDPQPTYVTGRRWDVLAANRAARALFADWPALPLEERNMLRWLFTDPRAREVFVDWEDEAAAMLARFRAAAARRPGDPEFITLIQYLRQVSREVRAWWPRHEVLPLGGGTGKRLRHPAVGEVTLFPVVLQVAEDPEQKLVTLSSAEGDDVLQRILAHPGNADLPRTRPE